MHRLIEIKSGRGNGSKTTRSIVITTMITTTTRTDLVPADTLNALNVQPEMAVKLGAAHDEQS